MTHQLISRGAHGGGLTLASSAAYLIGGNDDLYEGPVSIYATAGSWGSGTRRGNRNGPRSCRS